ncbi:MAG: methyltransferase family protein [Nocardioides sp.]|uniref:methyltransferase family protein n=1 Tax=Nocardioides sp. TaxID=35761 RepID=UPI003F025BC9
MTLPEPLLDADVQRNLVLGVALLAVGAAAVVRHLRTGLAGYVPAASLATLWAWLAVVAVEEVQTWWEFADAPTSFAGMPLEVSWGWALLWGALPVLAGGSRWLWLAGIAWVDAATMPLLTPLVRLEDGWLYGEVLLLVTAAAPALLLGYATTARRFLIARVLLQMTLFTGLFTWLVPTVTMRLDGVGWADVVDHSYPVRSLLLTVTVLLGVPVLAAVAELAAAGGTPYPWDPPERLVTTGPYAYLANPMQLGMSGLLLVLSLAAGSPRLGLAAAFAVLFSVVLAERHEHATLTARWPGYADYRRHVRNWWPRWRPYATAPATLWVSETCTLCDATGVALDGLGHTGLERRAAEGAPVPLTRMRWQAPEAAGAGTDDGVAAFARALEHTTVPWAWLGWCVRLPGVRQVLQLVADACGLGPRDLRPYAGTTTGSTMSSSPTSSGGTR